MLRSAAARDWCKMAFDCHSGVKCGWLWKRVATPVVWCFSNFPSASAAQSPPGCSSLTGPLKASAYFREPYQIRLLLVSKGMLWTEGFHKATMKQLLVPPSSFYRVG